MNFILIFCLTRKMPCERDLSSSVLMNVMYADADNAMNHLSFYSS